MQPDTERILKQLAFDLHDNESGEEANEELWAILSAMRGPDQNLVKALNNTFGLCLTDWDEFPKEATTIIIRAKVLGRYHRIVTRHSFPTFKGDSKELLEIRIKLDTLYGSNPDYRHFVGHAQKAFSILSLKWDEVNPIEKFPE